MRRSPSSALTTAAALAAGGVLLGGCGLLPSGGEPSAGRSEGPVDLLGHDTSDMAPLTVHLVVPQDEADPSFEGRAFGCGDLLVPVQTVPSGGVDRADTALDLLFDEDQGEHGDPTLVNEVEATSETLTPTGHRRDGDTEVFTFSGTVTAADACSAERIRAQLAETARSQTDAARVRLEVDGRDLDDVLGLAPLALGEPAAGGAAPASSTEPEPEPESTAEATPEPAPTPTPTPEWSAEPTPEESPEPTPEPEPTPSAEETAEPTVAPTTGEAGPTGDGADADEGRVTTPPEPPTDVSTGWNGADATATTAPLDAVPDPDGVDVGTTGTSDMSAPADAGTATPDTGGAETDAP